MSQSDWQFTLKNESYTFINKYYGTPPYHLVYDIKTNSEEKIVNLEMLEGFTIFDWCKVIENASKISIIDTSLNYIIEKIELKTNKVLESSLESLEGKWLLAKELLLAKFTITSL